jgi:hypothetical protein
MLYTIRHVSTFVAIIKDIGVLYIYKLVWFLILYGNNKIKYITNDTKLGNNLDIKIVKS